MLQELQNFTETQLAPTVTHAQQTITIAELPMLFSQKLILLKLDENSPLWDATDFPDQYEPVSYYPETKTVTHYLLKSGDDDGSTSITSYLLEYLQTGQVSPRDASGGSNVHNIPIPAFPIVEYASEFVPCVHLKNNKKALILANGTLIEGVTLTE